jgi:hypothetical protein
MAKGFHILLSDECFPTLTFMDVGGLVYFSKIIVWEFPHFSIRRCFHQLCELHALVEQQGYIASSIDL